MGFLDQRRSHDTARLTAWGFGPFLFIHPLTTMLTKNFQRLATEVQRHVAADLVAPGSYDTCFIGCLARQEDSPEFIEREYGIPLAVSRIAEAIFEGLPPDEAPLFFAALPDAVESDGKDLSCVVWQFLAAELRLLPPVEPEIQVIIDTVIDGIDLLEQVIEWIKECPDCYDLDFGSECRRMIADLKQAMRP